MTFDEMVADLQTRIGSDPEVTATQLKVWINQGMRTFCEEADFTWLERKKTASTVNGQAEYDLPEDYKRMVELRVDATSDDPNIFRLVPHETRDAVEGSDETYSIFAGLLDIHPTPSTTTSNNIEMWYIRRPTNMSDGSDSPSDSGIVSMPEAYHEALILYALAIFYTL